MYQGKEPWLEALTFSTANLLKKKRQLASAAARDRYICRKTPSPRTRSATPRECVPREEVTISLDATVLPLVTTRSKSPSRSGCG